MKALMKCIFFLGLLLFSSCSLNKRVTQEPTIGVKAVPTLVFDTPVVDFGDVVKGEKRSYSFTFTNTGNANLKIELATTCTCTSLDWPRLPIPPGGKGSIDIIFDSSSKDDDVSVDVDVIANTDPIVVTATIKAKIVVN